MILINEENELIQLAVDNRTGIVVNAQFLPDLLKLFEEYATIFSNDWLPKKDDDYSEWFDYNLGSLNLCYPWFFVRITNNRVTAAVWFDNWEYFGSRSFSCEVSAFSAKGIKPSLNLLTLRKTLEKLFKETDVQVVRSSFEESNRAAKIALMRAGFSNPVPIKCHHYRDGKECTNIMMSITRSEFEQSNG